MSGQTVCNRLHKSNIHVREREREMYYLMAHSTHFIYGYMESDIWLRTILVVRKETHCRHIGYFYWLTARVLLYAPSHRQDNTYKVDSNLFSRMTKSVLIGVYWSLRTCSNRTSHHYPGQPEAQIFHPVSTCETSSGDISENVHISRPTQLNSKRNGTGSTKCYHTFNQEHATSHSCMPGEPWRFYLLILVIVL